MRSSEDEVEVVVVEEVPGRRIRRDESWPEEREEEERPEEEKPEDEREDKDWPAEEDWPATAEETVWETRGAIWARIWEIRADWSREEVDEPEDRDEPPEDSDEPEEKPEEDRLDDPEDELSPELPVETPKLAPKPEDDPVEELEVDERDWGRLGLGTISTKPGCSDLSSVYPMAPAVYLTVIKDP